MLSVGVIFSIFTISLNVGIGRASAETTTATSMGIIIIPYFSPTSLSWNAVYQQAQTYPGTIKYVIINPCSGPCAESLSQDWQNVISNLKSYGIKTLGYIYYTKENLANIDYYMKDPPIKTDGIFFDKEGSSDNLVNFQQFASYIHNLGGIVSINPGYNYAPVIKYLTSGSADIANIYEAGASRINQMSVPSGIAPEKLSAIVKNVKSVSDMKSTVSEVAAKNVGNIYVTTKSYTTLPSYFSDEIQTASKTQTSG